MMQELNTRLLTLGGAGMRGKIGSGLTPAAASDFCRCVRFVHRGGEGSGRL